MLYRMAVLLLMTIATYAQKKPEEEVIIVRGSTYEGIIFPKPKLLTKIGQVKEKESFTPSLKEIEKMEQQVMLQLPQLYKQFVKDKSNIYDDIDCPIEENLKKFKRQYWGYVIKGEKRIYVNFLDPKWHNVKEPVLLLPTLGGCSKVVATYSIAKNKFTYFDMDFSGM